MNNKQSKSKSKSKSNKKELTGADKFFAPSLLKYYPNQFTTNINNPYNSYM